MKWNRWDLWRRLSWRDRPGLDGWLRRNARLIGGVSLLALGVAAVPSLSDAVWGGRHGWHRHDLGSEEGREHAHRMAHWVLRSVDASPEQENQVGALLDNFATRVARAQTRHRELHDELHAQLAAPAIDRIALDQLRSEALQLAESTSIEVVDLIASIAELLTPEQRTELLEMAEDWRH